MKELIFHSVPVKGVIRKITIPINRKPIMTVKEWLYLKGEIDKLNNMQDDKSKVYKLK
jgi:hypothetical protein